MHVLIAGASGLIGQSLLSQLLVNTQIKNISAFVRSDLKLANSKLKSILTSFDNLEQKKIEKADIAFCCLGTTLKKAGSKEAFYQVDHDYVLNFAYTALKAEVKTFVIVSAMGADPKANVFYNRVKGQAEEDLKRLKFAHLIILQPSLLLGERSESRPGEKVAQILTHFLNPLLIGPLAKARPIAATQVAAKMLAAGLNPPLTQIAIIPNHEI